VIFQYDILGIAADFNDVNYLNPGDQEGISRMTAVQNDSDFRGAVRLSYQ